MIRKPRPIHLLIGLLAMTAALHPADAPAAGDAAPVAAIESGPLVGLIRGGQRQFLGIPFAAPPIGPLRWQPPQPVQRWDKPLRADRFGDICPQADNFGLFARPSQQEDCLSLNVFAPARLRRRLPVMVWIHGGGLKAGSSADYDASALAAEGVVVVSFNYRLGVLGYFANPGLGKDNASPNYGMLDQIAALRWVQRNIAAFGGDPENVTVFGESAGARSIAALLASPQATGLFRRAIMQSLNYENTGIAREAAERSGRTFAANAGCGVEDAACLRALSIKALLRAQGSSSVVPILGGSDLPESPQSAVEAGRIHRVPVMVGWNRDETTWQTGIAELKAGRPLSVDDVREIAGTRTGHNAALQARAMKLYMAAHASPSLAASAMKTDSGFVCPVKRMLRSMSAHVPAYAFEFADRNAPQFNPKVSFPYGAAHTSELQYLFPGFRGAAGTYHPLSSSQLKLAAKMRRLWTHFARNGTPGSTQERVRWTRYDAVSDNVLILATPAVRIQSRPHDVDRNCSFWDQL
ncbi:MAG: carboxylesterase/lipase family protein [Pseudorhodoplanes sp.]